MGVWYLTSHMMRYVHTYLEIVPPPPDASAVLVEQLSESDGHLLLHHDGVVHVSRHGEQLRAVVVLPKNKAPHDETQKKTHTKKKYRTCIHAGELLK